MTKWMASQEGEKSPPEALLEDDDDLKKNNNSNDYHEILDADVKSVAAVKAAKVDNAANENLYAEIHLDDDHFENAVYMQGIVLDVPTKSPATRSFYPSPPTLPPKIPTEPAPSWCCGTRRRRRRSLILGLVVTTLFLLFFCIALLIRMYTPTLTEGGFQSSEASAFLGATEFNLGKEKYEFKVTTKPEVQPEVTTDMMTEMMTEMTDLHGYTTNQPTTGRNGYASTASRFGAAAATGSDVGEGVNVAAEVEHAEATVAPTRPDPKPLKTFHVESICTSWTGQRQMQIGCAEGRTIEVSRAFYGWSHKEEVCREVSGDTTCRHSIGEDFNCDGYSDCNVWATASTPRIGCFGWHDFLQVEYFCKV